MSNSTATRSLTRSQTAVLSVLTSAGTIGMIFSELESAPDLRGYFSPSRIRTAVAELRRLGLVRASITTMSDFSRPTTIWVAR